MVFVGGKLGEDEVEQDAVLNLAIIDIEQRKKTEEAQQLAASVFVNAREGIMITDGAGKIMVVNEAFSRITEYSALEVYGKSPQLLKSGLQGQEFYAQMWADLKANGHVKVDLWNRKKSGELFSVAQTITTIFDESGAVKNYVSLFSDVTQLKRQEEQLKHIAHYDPLTNLPNRLLLADRLHLALMQAKRNDHIVAVAFLDFDGFKEINDLHGHDIGDQLLVALSKNMEAEMREGDTLARLGGDEFVAVIGNLESVEASLPVLERLLLSTSIPSFIGELKLQITSSIGVSFFPQLDNVDADQLLRQADQAMYQAKLEGKNQYHIFDAELDRSVRSYHESITEIKTALYANEFVLHYQPKVDMRKGELVGMEALIRWHHPQRGLLLPCAFLPEIENHVLMIEVGEWVIHEVLRQMSEWKTRGVHVSVSVNIGARHLQQSDFVERLRQILAAYPEVDPVMLEFEILEVAPLKDVAHVINVLAQCRELGVRFSLDDFGTGYSSISYLKKLPVGQLKIDQGFVRDMLKNSKDVAILKGVIALAQAFSCDVIAEGVETEEQELTLLALGCDMVQGFGIAPAMPAEAFLYWMENWTPKSVWRVELN
jgi:diguanylate cyclase (GGDEF)-like protein/PAS domain S-box-containing protein